MAHYSPIKQPRRSALARALQAAVDGVRRYAPWISNSLGPVKRAASGVFYGWMAKGDRRNESLHAAQMARWRAGFRAETHAEIDPATGSLFGADGVVATTLRSRSVSAAPSVGVLHCIGGLGPGGAERQLCLLMQGARRDGVPNTLLTLRPLKGADGHYRDRALASADRVVLVEEAESMSKGLEIDAGVFTLLQRLPGGYVDDVRRIWAACSHLRPTVLHAWLDPNNICGAIGAVLAGVPRIVLGLRNVSPRHFPHLLLPEMRELYAELARVEPHDRIRWIANTAAGAKDYAEWIGMPVERIRVIHNGLDEASLDGAAQGRTVARGGGVGGGVGGGDRAGVRRSIGVSADAPILLGVFRLSDEKRPLFWLELVERVLRETPQAWAVHVGDGVMEREFAARLRASPMRERIRHLGRRDDVHELMAASEVILLASRAEGMPNVLLEAQALGCVPVATAVGGAPDAVESGIGGELRGADDAEGLVSATISLLRDPERRARMAAAGRERVRRRFSVRAMVDATREVWAL
ncbi:MAG: glycosyltransferase [Phycisphaerae bacterium]|nr:glycosyltransferase [Phycisphaerae bacterium]